MEKSVAVVMMAKYEAVAWRQEVGEQGVRLRELLWDGFEREAWKALGFSSWTACLKDIREQYGLSERHLWRLHEANKTERRLAEAKGNEAEGTDPMSVDDQSVKKVGNIPERVLREVAKAPEDKQAEVYEKAAETAPNGNVTASHVRQTVEDTGFRNFLKGGVKPKEQQQTHLPVSDEPMAEDDLCDTCPFLGDDDDSVVRRAGRVIMGAKTPEARERLVRLLGIQVEAAW